MDRIEGSSRAMAQSSADRRDSDFAVPLEPGPVEPLPADAAPLRPVRRTHPPSQPDALPRPISVSRVSNRVAIRPDDADETPPLVQSALRGAPPWLVSLVVHLALMLVLGLLLIPVETSDAVRLLAGYSEEPIGLDNAMIQLAPVDPDPDDAVSMVAELEVVEDPYFEPPKLEILPSGTLASGTAPPDMSVAFLGRTEGMRDALGRAYGATGESDRAVLAALAWIARQQRKDGTWSLRGPYPDGADTECTEAATAMALLAFLGYGNTHLDGPYRRNVDRGIRALIERQNRDGDFFRNDEEGRSDNRLYAHGQCTIAICELYGMTRDTQLLDPATRAVQYCVWAQAEEGGWKYRPQYRSDTSVTGWVLMALQSARMAGIEVPSPTLGRVTEFLDSVANESGDRYAYQQGEMPRLTMTAEALLCRQYLGWSHTDPRLVAGADYVLDSLPRWSERDVYYWYYATQVMHHMEGHYWERWNSVMRDMLVEHQERQGSNHGSWDPLGRDPDKWSLNGYGGRLYVTCLSVYNLEVYYRHLPIYSGLDQRLGTAR